MARPKPEAMRENACGHSFPVCADDTDGRVNPALKPAAAGV